MQCEGRCLSEFTYLTRVVRQFPSATLAIFFVGAQLLFASCTVTRENPKLEGQDVRLTLLHTSDIHSRLFPYNVVPTRTDKDFGLLPENAPFGGAARMATIVREQREKTQRSLWLDSGDCFQGAPVFNMYKGEAELRALSQMGMDAAVIGNHEFDLGTDNLQKQLSTWAEFSPLVANYDFEEPANRTKQQLSDVAEPYVIFDEKGLKVGVIGMGNWSSMTGIFEGGNSLGIRPRVDAEVVSEYVRLLRPSVDVLIVLSHLGLDEDEGLGAHEVPDRNRELPAEGVDIILGGHLHVVLSPPEVIHTDFHGNKTYLTHPGAFAKYVLRHDVVVRVGEDNSNPAKRSRIQAISSEVIPVDSRVAEDPQVVELLHPYSVALAREIDLGGVFSFVDVEGNGKITRNDSSGGDSQLGNLVARSMQTRSGVEAEFALTNSLGIRADFEPGPLTIEQTFNTFPFENTITVMFLSGVEVQGLLDFVSRRSAERGCRSQAQVAGIYFDMVCDGDCPGGQRSCAKNIFLGDECRGDDSNGPIDPSRCAPVVPAGLYKVAVNDYIANGGSGFRILKQNTSKQNTGVSLRDALVDFLRRQELCEEGEVDFTDIGQKTIDENWGRISCLNGKAEPHDGRIRPVFE